MSEENRPEGRQRRTVILLLGVIALILVGWALKATYIISMPVALAFFLAVVLYPVQKWLNGHLPRKLQWLSLLAVMAIFLAVLAAAGGAVWFAVDRVAEKGPEYQGKFQEIGKQVQGWAQQHNLPVQRSVLEADAMRQKGMEYLRTAVNSVLHAAALITLVFFLLLLMLLETHTWRDKSRNIFRHRNAGKIFETVEAIGTQVRRYLVVRTVVSAITAVVLGAWLWIMGVEFPLLWALLAFLLNYIPNIGSIIYVIPPTLMAFLQFGVGKGLGVLAGLLVIEQVIGNYIDPRLQGKKMSISPLVVLVSVIFWGWAWGTVGAVIAVPLMATIIIICSHIPALRPVALLLSDAPDQEELEKYTKPK